MKRDRQYSATSTSWAATYKCKECGKEFTVPPYSDWGYRYGATMCCSYHCMRAMRAADLAKAAAPKPKPEPKPKPCKRVLVSDADKSAFYKLRLEGKTYMDITRITGWSRATVEYHLRKAGLV